MPDQTPVTDDDRKAHEWASDPIRHANGLLAPAPQIIRTVEELEALDPDTVVLDGVGEIYPVRYYLDADDDEKTIYERYLPAVVITPADQVRACREALEGGPL